MCDVNTHTSFKKKNMIDASTPPPSFFLFCSFPIKQLIDQIRCPCHGPYLGRLPFKVVPATSLRKTGWPSRSDPTRWPFFNGGSDLTGPVSLLNHPKWMMLFISSFFAVCVSTCSCTDHLLPASPSVLSVVMKLFFHDLAKLGFDLSYTMFNVLYYIQYSTVHYINLHGCHWMWQTTNEKQSRLHIC